MTHVKGTIIPQIYMHILAYGLCTYMHTFTDTGVFAFRRFAIIHECASGCICTPTYALADIDARSQAKKWQEGPAAQLQF
jgi:hypothetical protein